MEVNQQADSDDEESDSDDDSGDENKDSEDFVDKEASARIRMDCKNIDSVDFDPKGAWCRFVMKVCVYPTCFMRLISHLLIAVSIYRQKVPDCRYRGACRNQSGSS
jgi:hypothetical protein